MHNVLFLIVPPAPPHHLRRLSQANSALLTSHTTLSPSTHTPPHPPNALHAQRDSPFFPPSLPPRLFLPRSPRGSLSLSLCCVSAFIRASIFPPLSSFFFSALTVPHCMDVPCRVHASAPPTTLTPPPPMSPPSSSPLTRVISLSYVCPSLCVCAPSSFVSDSFSWEIRDAYLAPLFFSRPAPTQCRARPKREKNK